jgi:hypothetical protein
LLALVVASASAPVFAGKTKEIKTVGTYEASEQHKTFIADFAKLMKAHPDAARQFSLVDMGFQQPIARVIVWECEDFGGALDPPDCKPVILE